MNYLIIKLIITVNKLKVRLKLIHVVKFSRSDLEKSGESHCVKKSTADTRYKERTIVYNVFAIIYSPLSQ